MSILVTTPTGQIGRQVLQRLLDAGADVTVLARDPARLPEATRARVRVVAGALEDGHAVREALRGARAAFFLLPPHLTTDDWAGWQRAVGRTFAESARAEGVGRIVLLSSAGAQRDDFHAVSRLGEIERMLAATVPHVRSLRAGFFFENFLAAVPTLAADGAIYMTLPAERRLAMVATRDIGEVAADLLLDDAWSGDAVRGVHGPADLTLREATQAIGQALGVAARYVEVPDAAMRGALLALGASTHVADEYPRLMRALGTTPDYQAEPRTAATTTPTTIGTWATEVLAPAVHAAAHGARDARLAAAPA